MAIIEHTHDTLDEMADEVARLAKAGAAQTVNLPASALEQLRPLLKAKGYGMALADGGIRGTHTFLKAAGDPPAGGSRYDGADRCTEADKFNAEIFADPIVIGKLSKSDQEFVEKAQAALADPKIGAHAKDITKGQLEQLARQYNNGGAVDVDFA